MSTYMPKAADIERKWYVLDAEGKPLGRVAAVAADLLRGKRKTTFDLPPQVIDQIIMRRDEERIH